MDKEIRKHLISPEEYEGEHDGDCGDGLGQYLLDRGVNYYTAAVANALTQPTEEHIVFEVPRFGDKTNIRSLNLDKYARHIPEDVL